MDIEFGKDLQEYQRHLQSTKLQATYNRLMAFVANLRNHFDEKYSNDYTVGDLYEGRLDTTYFPIAPDVLKNDKLKFNIVFDHANMRFEIWLVGLNRDVQRDVWARLKQENWNKYPLTATPDQAIIQNVMFEQGEFAEKEIFTKMIDDKAMAFINDILKDPELNTPSVVFD